MTREARWHLTAIGLIALGGLLRITLLGQQSYWVDEIRSVILSEPHNAWGRAIFDIHGPLHLVLLKIWMFAFGGGEAATRALSAVFGTIGLWIFYRIAVPLVGSRAALIALLLLAVSPLHLWYSQETRNYALLFDIGLLTLLAFVNEVERPTGRTFVIAVLCGVLTGLSNLSGFFMMAFLIVFSVISGRRTGYPKLRAIVICILICVMLIPLLTGSMGQFGDFHLGRPDEASSGKKAVRGESPWGLLSIPFTVYTFSFGYSLGPSIHELKTQHWDVIVPFLPYIIPASLVFAMLALWGIRATFKRRRDWNILLLWLAVPIILMVTLSLVNLKAPNPRYALLSLAPYLLLLGAGVSSIRNRALRMTALLLLLIPMANADYNHFTNPRYWRPDGRAAGELLEREGRAGDVVVSCGVPEPVLYYGPDHIPQTQRPEAGTFDREGLAEAWLDGTMKGRQRLWYVKINGWWGDAGNRLLNACRETMIQRGEWRLEKALVYLFEKKDAPGEQPEQRSL